MENEFILSSPSTQMTNSYATTTPHVQKVYIYEDMKNNVLQNIDHDYLHSYDDSLNIFDIMKTEPTKETKESNDEY